MVKLLKSRYNSSGDRCVDACLNYGSLRYRGEKGEIVTIEVPYDKYDEALTDFNARVKDNLVDSDIVPSDVLKRGSFTYNQTKSIAILNKIKLINYYDIDGSMEIDHVLGMSGALEYALATWDGDEKDEAIVKSIIRSCKIHGENFVKSLNLEARSDAHFEDICKNIQKLEELEQTELYRFKSYKIESDSYKQGRGSFQHNRTFVISAIITVLGFIVAQFVANYLGMTDISVTIILAVVALLIFGLMCIKAIKAAKNNITKQANTNILELFNDELEINNFNNILTDTEHRAVLNNITKGEFSKLISEMRGSVNKKISINNIVTKETEIILSSRDQVFLPAEGEIALHMDRLIRKHYNVLSRGNGHIDEKNSNSTEQKNENNNGQKSESTK